MGDWTLSFTGGQLLAFGALLCTIVGLVSPGMYKLGKLEQRVQRSEADINEIKDMHSRIFERLDELRDMIRNGGK